MNQNRTTMLRLVAFLVACVSLVSVARAQDATSFRLDLILHGTIAGGQPVNDFANRIRFEPDALIGWDQHDGSKFIPLDTPYSLLSPEGTYEGQPKRQSVRSLPSSLADDHNEYTVPLGFLSTDPGSFTIAAVPVDIPDGWGFTLRDLQTSQTVDLLEDTYSFDGVVADTVWQERFEIEIEPLPLIAAGEEGPGAFHLSRVAPNPASRSAALTLRVQKPQWVTARVFDALGRHVSTVYEKALGAGEEMTLALDTSEWTAGAYVVLVEGETFSEARKFAVVQ